MNSADNHATTTSLTEFLKAEARRLGFTLAGVCPAVSPPGLSHFHDWLDRCFDGEMHYLRNRRDAYSHPDSVLEGVRSLLMLAMPYRTEEPREPLAGQGKISRYAWGDRDYHDHIHQRLKELISVWQSYSPSARLRGVVDTAPLLEREFAQLAGLGWIGKNTLLLNKSQGSWFFLAAILADQELEYDAKHASDHCGTCRACLDACPTNAFPEPYVLDATRCISYLTIELRGSIPLELRNGMQDWVFGCDVCQTVCPWNRRAPQSSEEVFQPSAASNPIDLRELFYLDDESFRARFRRTPLWRPRRRGILRNAAIVLGNQRDEAATSALARGLGDPDAIIRAACAWALGRIGTPEARQVLMEAHARETETDVVSEIETAMAEDELTGR